ncbi:hypothetical protein [Bradyrhizobium sp. B120]|uniref:hypothetical protein n=1 Tax=Bradyrhizobium sp. B120 TaxID=3410088 RepID=UPI003B9833D1
MTIASSIRRFSCWLYDENKPGIIVRPHDPSLDKDAELCSLSRGRKIINALAHLRSFLLSARAPEILASRLAAYPEDAALIQRAAEAARADIARGTPWQGFETPRGVSRSGSILRAFSVWLQTHGKSAIAGRLDDQSLRDDVQRYKRATNIHSVGAKLKLLWKYNSLRGSPAISDDLDLLELLEREMEVDEPPSAAGDVASQQSLLQASPAATISDNSLNLLELLEREIEVEWPPSAAGEGTSRDTSLQVSTVSAATSDRDLELLALLERGKEIGGPRSAAGEAAPRPSSLQAPPAAAGIGDDGLELWKQLAQLERELEADGPSSVSWENDPRLTSFEELLDGVLAAPGTPLESPRSPLRYPDGSLNFDTALRDEVRNDAHNSRAWCELGQPQQSSYPAAAMPAQAPAYDFGHVVGLGFNHGPQAAPDVLIGSLNRRGMLPQSFQEPTSLIIHGQPYMAVLGPGMREVTPNNPFCANIILKPRLKGG